MQIALNLFIETKQHVKIESIISSPINIEYGVPQGTVLGPIHFNMYFNDVFSIKSPKKIVSYADDKIILYTAEKTC